MKAPPSLTLPHKGGGDAHHYPLPLDGGGLGWGWSYTCGERHDS